MTQKERNILSPLVRTLRTTHPGIWSSLKNETQFGPEFSDFPYHPAALDLQQPARQMVGTLEPGQRAALLEAWRSKPHLLHLERDEDILNQYAVVLLDLLLRRARQAAARSSDL